MYWCQVYAIGRGGDIVRFDRAGFQIKSTILVFRICSCPAAALTSRQIWQQDLIQVCGAIITEQFHPFRIQSSLMHVVGFAMQTINHSIALLHDLILSVSNFLKLPDVELQASQRLTLLLTFCVRLRSCVEKCISKLSRHNQKPKCWNQSTDSKLLI